jgi:hypothetical protein
MRKCKRRLFRDRLPGFCVPAATRLLHSVYIPSSCGIVCVCASDGRGEAADRRVDVGAWRASVACPQSLSHLLGISPSRLLLSYFTVNFAVTGRLGK